MTKNNSDVIICENIYEKYANTRSNDILNYVKPRDHLLFKSFCKNYYRLITGGMASQVLSSDQ